MWSDKGVVLPSVLHILSAVRILKHMYFVHMLAQMTKSIVHARAVQQMPTQISALSSSALWDTGRL